MYKNNFIEIQTLSMIHEPEKDTLYAKNMEEK